MSRFAQHQQLVISSWELVKLVPSSYLLVAMHTKSEILYA